MNKLQLLLFTVLLTSLSGSAFDFKEGNIYYDVTGSNKVKVTYVHYGPSGYDYYGYSGDVNIPPTVTHNGTTYQVTAIGDHAFINCPDLTSVFIPNTVTFIGNDAFLFCTGLRLMTIPNSVTCIETNAFYGCSGMKRVVIGTGVTYIGEYAFCDCYNLNFVGCLASTPPTMAASNVFDDDTYSYASLGVPKGRESAYQAANWWKNFYKFEELPYDFVVNDIYYTITGSNTVEVATAATDTYSGSVNIPSSVPYNGKTYQVTGIGMGAFAYCTQLTAVTIPETVTYISDYAFVESPFITTISIPCNVTTIGERAFAHCTALSWVRIGSSVETIGNDAFWDCEALRDVLCDAITPPTMEGEFEDETYSDGTLTVPKGCKNAYKAADGWKQFTTIKEGDSSFDVNNIFYKITSSNTVEVVAISDDYSGSLTIPSSAPFNGNTYQVTSIGDEAFSRRYNLTSVTIPNSVTTIGDYAFYLCYNLTSVRLPNSLAVIGDHMFYGCNSLNSITIPEGVTSIGNSAFMKCYDLTSVTIPNSVTSIGVWAFEECEGLTDLTIGSGVAEIWENAFMGCSALTTVTCLATTPPTMANPSIFDDGVYSNATLRVPNSSRNTYKTANWWKNFTHIESICDFMVDGIYYNYTGTGTVEVTYKDKNYNCYSGNVVIPASVTYNGITYSVTGIGPNAFRESPGLTDLTIPSSVTTIGSLAFYYCTGLASINCRAMTPPSQQSAFDTRHYNNTILYVPLEALTAYQQANGWKNFTHYYVRDYDFLYNGIGYQITSDNTVSVAVRDFSINGEYNEFYSGDVVIPASVTYNGTTYSVTGLRPLSFAACPSLTSLTIPKTVTFISIWAVIQSPNLNCLTCQALMPPTMEGGDAFDSDAYSGITLFVPKSSISAYMADENWHSFTTIKPTLDYALNSGDVTIEFTSTGTYPWTNMVEGNRVYAQSGNKGIHSSTSTMTTTVTLGSGGSVSFDFKAWGEGVSYDRCIFSVDGTQRFSYGARKNDWETYTTQLAAGTHTLTWTYSKDGNVNPEGDYFAIDNVVFSGIISSGDIDGDGQITIGDVTALTDLILSGNATVQAYPAADVDADGQISIADVTSLIDQILGGN